MARRGHLVPSSVPTSSSDPAPALTLRKEDKLAGHNGRVFDLQASVKDLSSSQPLRIAAVGEKGGSVWTFDGGARRHVRLPGTELMRVCWHPDGEHVLTGSAEGAICVRDASSGQTSATLQAAREDEVYGLEVLSEEGLLAAGAGETVQLWDLNRATRTSLAAFTATESGVHFGARTLPRQLRHFRDTSPRQRAESTLARGHFRDTSPPALAARRAASRASGSPVCAPPCRTGGLRNPDRKAFVFSIAARGRILSAALSDGSLRLLDSETLQELATLCVSNEAPSLATAPLGPPRAILGTLGYSRVLSGTLGYSRVI